MSKYAGADWVRRNARKGQEMSALGERVADTLGDVFFGIYHIDTRDLDRVDWGHDYVICVPITSRDLATTDGDALTRLVVLAHDRMLRMSIHPKSKHAVELMFHHRETREAAEPLYKRCPTMEDHMQSIRKHYQEEE